MRHGRGLSKQTTPVSFVDLIGGAHILRSSTGFDYPFTDNLALNQTLAQYELPVVTHSTIESDGYGTYTC